MPLVSAFGYPSGEAARSGTSLSAALRIEWISEADRLEFLEQPWRDLEMVVHERTHLASFDFLSAWYGHYAGEYGGLPLVGLAWRGARLVGVAPLALRRGGVAGVPARRVEFAPTDTPAGEFLIEDNCAETLTALLDGLARHTVFDVMALDSIEPGSSTFCAMEEWAAARGFDLETTDHACARVDLRGGYEKYHASLSGHYRRNLNNKARRIDAAGGVVNGIQLTKGVEAIDRCIDRMIAITEASYKLEGRRLADHHRQYLAELIRRFGGRGILSLPILSIGGEDAAFIIGVVERGVFYDITLAYAERFEKLSPGAVLMQKTIEQLAAAGVHTVISHGAHEYKRHWATEFVPQKRVFLFPPRLRARLARFARFTVAPLWRREAEV
jgi:CelD/BcsL family acetyltransferase involved in cellulose biosynthesis